MVRSLILRIGYFFCVLCKSTTYHLIFAIVKDWSSCRRFFFVRRLRKSRSLATCAWRYKWNSTCRLQTSKNTIFSTSAFDYSGTEVFAGFADLKGKKKDPAKLKSHLTHPGWLIPYRLSVLSAIFSFFNSLDSCFWFHACFVLPRFLYESGWCMSCLPLKRARKKKGRQQKCKRNVHYSIIGLGHSCKACVRLITWGDFRQVYRGVASFSTSCRPGWLSLPHILKIARMISTHWLQRHFELFSFLAHPSNA